MNTQVKVNKSTYTQSQIVCMALGAICAECVRSNNPLMRAEIDLGVEDIVISVQVMNKARNGTMSKYEIRDVITNLAEQWVA